MVNTVRLRLWRTGNMGCSFNHSRKRWTLIQRALLSGKVAFLKGPTDDLDSQDADQLCASIKSGIMIFESTVRGLNW